MALWNCPQCGKLVSSFVEVCDNCGCKISELRKVGNDILDIINETFQIVVNSPRDKLIDMASNATKTIFAYLNKKFDETSAGEIYLTLVSTCFAADGQLSYDEYALLVEVSNIDTSYNECLSITRHVLDSNDMESIDDVITTAPKTVRIAVSDLCMAISAIDGVITIDEKNLCMKYFVCALNK